MAPLSMPQIPQGRITAILGGLPTNATDGPISVVLLALFVGSAATHMTIFQRNRIVHKQPFLPSTLMFGLSMCRIATLVMRIVWANRLLNARIAIAASILAQAGVVLLFLLNLILAHRIAVALLANTCPRIVKIAAWALRLSISVVLAMLVAVITGTVEAFYTRDPAVRLACRKLQLVGITLLAILAFAPIPVIAGSLLARRPRGVRAFGTGSMQTKIVLVLGASALLSLGAAYRASIAYLTPSLAMNSPLVGRAPYYTVNFVIELIIVYAYAVARVDRRFRVVDWKTAEAEAEAKIEAIRSSDGEKGFGKTSGTDAESGHGKLVLSHGGNGAWDDAGGECPDAVGVDAGSHDRPNTPVAANEVREGGLVQ